MTNLTIARYSLSATWLAAIWSAFAEGSWHPIRTWFGFVAGMLLMGALVMRERAQAREARRAREAEIQRRRAEDAWAAWERVRRAQRPACQD